MKFSSLTTVLTHINSHPGLQRIFNNTGWLFLDNLTALLAGFLVGAWMARYLGPAQYGFYSYALAFPALLAPIASLGLNSIVVREIVRNPIEKLSILGTTLILKLIASFLIIGFTISFISFLHPDDDLVRILVSIAAIGLIFQAFSNTITCWFESQVQSKYLVWSKNVALVLAIIIKVTLILNQASVLAFVVASLVQTVCFTVAVALFYYRSGGHITAWQVQNSLATRLLKDSCPLMFSGLSVVIYMKIDQLMLGTMVSKEVLGIYSVAVRLSELWYFLPMAVAVSVFPAIVRSREMLPEVEYHKRLQFFYDVMALVAYVIVVPCTLLSTPLVLLFFGHAYVEAGPILAVHIWAFIFVSLGVARSQWLIAENLVTFSMIATVLGGIVNISLNLFLIPEFSGLGAAWATVISYAISGYLSSLITLKIQTAFKQQTISLLIPFHVLSLRKRFYEIIKI